MRTAHIRPASLLRSSTINAADALVDTNFIANSEREEAFVKEKQNRVRGIKIE
jgi:hypothetical protein